MKKEKLLIIDKHHFGTLTDSYKWCEYLKEHFDIEIICFDTGEKKYIMDNVKIKYVPYNGNFFLRGIRFIIFSLWNIILFKGKILVVYFEKCIFFKYIFPLKKMILDIRTLSVSENKKQRIIFDEKIKHACQKYDFVTVISEGVKQKLNLPENKIFILPLGSDVISTAQKDYSKIRMLYVGTFSGRDLYKTIEGLANFIHDNPNADIFYEIVGDGFGSELDEYKALSEKLNIGKYIKFHGRVPYNELKPLFDKSNIGVSFVPITEYYDNQPPTKTFEYVLSGLYTIATATKSNKDLIKKYNGILINDTADDFYNALIYIWNNRTYISEKLIRESLTDYTWDKIVKNKLLPILNKI